MKDETFFFGDWQVDPKANSLSSTKQVKQLEPKAMDVLLLLCQRCGEVLSSDDIVSHCWPDAEVGDNPLHKIINQLRRALGDSATSPTYIETIRKRGYRTLAEVRFPIGHEASADSQTWQSGSPFPGLQAYSADFAQVFYGRSAQITILLDRISQQITYGRAFCLVLGPSGSGKSSLINAGVVPNLLAEQGYKGNRLASYTSLDFADVSGAQLFIELASSLLDWELADMPVFDGESAETLANKLRSDPDSVIQTCQQALQQHPEAGAHFGVFVDRLEVLLSSPLFNDTEREQFIDLLERLATSGAVLVLSACRNDFYPLLVSHPSLMAGKARGAHFDLAPPSRSELLQMIRLPAKAANLSWDLDIDTAMPLDEMLCAEAANNPDALPMLQYTLQALYLARSEDNKLLVSVYKDLGGLEGAIGKNAEFAIENMGAEQQSSLTNILSLLVTLRDDEQSVTSRSARWSQLKTDAEKALVQAMVDSRLFVSHLQNQEASFSIAHEALLRRWPRATNWIDEHKDSLSIKSRLQHLSKRWLQEGKHKAYLLAEGKPLKEAKTLSQNPLFNLEKQDTALIKASTQRASMMRWTRRITASLLGVLTLVSVLMSVRSFEAEQQAQEKRLAAEDLLGFMVGDFADKMRGIGRMDLLDGISNKALDYFSGIALDDNSLSFDTRFQHAQTLEAMGEVAYSRNKIEEARTALLAANQGFTALLDSQPESLSLLKSMGANAFWLGQLDYDVSDWESARPWFEQYLVYSQTMYRLAPEDKDALMELSYAHNTLGSLAMKLQEFDKARAEFQQSLELKLLALEQEPGNTQLIADVADTRSWLASAVESNGNYKEALRIHDEIQSTLLKVDIESSAVISQYLALSYQQSVELLRHQNKKKEALGKALNAFRLLEKLLETDSGNQSWRTSFHYSKFLLLTLNSTQGIVDNDFTPERIQASWEKEMKELQGSPRYQTSKALMHLTISKYYHSRGDWSIAREHLVLGEDILMELLSIQSENLKYLTWLAEFELLRSEIHRAKNDDESRQVSCDRAIKILEPIQLNNKDIRVIIPYAKALKCKGTLKENIELVRMLSDADVVSVNF